MNIGSQPLDSSHPLPARHAPNRQLQKGDPSEAWDRRNDRFGSRLARVGRAFIRPKDGQLYPEIHQWFTGFAVSGGSAGEKLPGAFPSSPNCDWTVVDKRGTLVSQRGGCAAFRRKGPRPVRARVGAARFWGPDCLQSRQRWLGAGAAERSRSAPTLLPGPTVGETRSTGWIAERESLPLSEWSQAGGHPGPGHRRSMVHDGPCD
jgi:hypothetical protein